MRNSIISIQDVSVYQLVAFQAGRDPGAVAIASPGRSPLTYGRLLTQIEDVGKTLASLGISRNSRVAVVLPNGPEMAVVFLAISAAATCAPLNPALTESEFGLYLSNLNPDAIIVESAIDSPAIKAAQDRGIAIIQLSPISEGPAGTLALKGRESLPATKHRWGQDDDVALLLHTSGTTSRPKLVPLTHSNVCASAHKVSGVLQLTETDRCLNVMPLFHIHGIVGAFLSSICAGASVVCASGFDPEQFLSWLQLFRPTWYTAVPTIHQAVLSLLEANPEVLKDYSFRFARSSSSPLAPALTRRLEDVLHAPVIEAYGMTEAAHQICSNPAASA